MVTRDELRTLVDRVSKCTKAGRSSSSSIVSLNKSRFDRQRAAGLTWRVVLH